MDQADLAAAFAEYQTRVEQMRVDTDWSAFADLFAPDADYVEHAFGTLKGREQIRAWVTNTMGRYPGNVMTGFPPAWHVLDPESNRVVCEIRNLMPDLGDGVVREASNITILTLGDEGLWVREEDVYNPAHFLELALDWARAAREVGQLPDDAAAFLAHFDKAGSTA